MAQQSVENVVVVGGGVIGAMCAWYLSQSGYRVTIVDRDKFGAACSHGNCGYVSPSHVLPLPQPGAVRGAVGDLFRSNSPLCIRLKWSPSLWAWLWKFSRRCNQKDMLDAARGRSDLLQSSQDLFKQLVSKEQIECEWQEVGLLFVHLTKHHFEAYKTTNQLITDHFGVSAEPIAGADLSDFEPALKDGLGGGWYYRDDCHLRPDMLMASLRKKLEGRGARFIENMEVQKFVRDGQVCKAISGNGQQVSADAFVVASGAWSPFLNRELGCKFPIQPGKGYSLTMPRPKVVPKVPLIFEEHRVAITPMHTKYRIGSTMEFAGYDPTINKRRLQLLKDSASHYLREPYCAPVEEEWFGWRPMTWDGKPVIDRSPIMENVWVAAGHNMLGISMATGTGKLVTEMISGQQPHLDLNHYSLSRLKTG